MLGKNAKQLAKSGSVRNIHVFCVERKCVIEEGFCRYVCPESQECSFWRDERELFRQMTKPIFYDQRLSQFANTKEQLKPNTLTPKQHSVNFTPDPFLETSPATMNRFNELRKAPWIGHVEGYKWPECECAACCSELLINLMQETHSSSRQKTQHSSHTQTALT